MSSIQQVPTDSKSLLVKRGPSEYKRRLPTTKRVRFSHEDPTAIPSGIADRIESVKRKFEDAMNSASLDAKIRLVREGEAVLKELSESYQQFSSELKSNLFRVKVDLHDLCRREADLVKKEADVELFVRNKESEFRKHHQHFEDLNRKLQATKTQQSEQLLKIVNLQEKLVTGQEDLSLREVAVSEALQANEKILQQIENGFKELEAKKLDLAEKEKELSEFKNHMDILKMSVDQANQQVSKLKQDLDQKKREVRELKFAKADDKQQVDGLNKTLHVANQQVQRLKEVIQAKTQKMEQLSQDLLALQGRQRDFEYWQRDLSLWSERLALEEKKLSDGITSFHQYKEGWGKKLTQREQELTVSYEGLKACKNDLMVREENCKNKEIELNMREDELNKIRAEILKQQEEAQIQINQLKKGLAIKETQLSQKETQLSVQEEKLAKREALTKKFLEELDNL